LKKYEAQAPIKQMLKDELEKKSILKNDKKKKNFDLRQHTKFTIQS
jgi:hypothetical protein